MIHVRTITIELTQQLDTGEEQSLIVEYDGETPIISTDAWTQGRITIPDIIETADTCYATAKLRIAAIEESLL
jgi:hypothetical protein